MKIYLVRHGQTKANAEKKYLGRGASPFTELGTGQNKSALSNLMGRNIEEIYSSPADRCSSCAQKLAKKKSMESIEDARIAEIDFGVFEGLTWQEAKGKYPAEFEEFCKNPNEFGFPGGESQEDLHRRVALFIDEILQMPHEEVVVFSHGGTIMAMLRILLELRAEQKWRFKVEHGAIVTVEINDGYACLVLGEI